MLRNQFYEYQTGCTTPSPQTKAFKFPVSNSSSWFAVSAVRSFERALPFSGACFGKGIIVQDKIEAEKVFLFLFCFFY